MRMSVSIFHSMGAAGSVAPGMPHEECGGPLHPSGMARRATFASVKDRSRVRRAMACRRVGSRGDRCALKWSEWRPTGRGCSVSSCGLRLSQLAREFGIRSSAIRLVSRGWDPGELRIRPCSDQSLSAPASARVTKRATAAARTGSHADSARAQQSRPPSRCSSVPLTAPVERYHHRSVVHWRRQLPGHRSPPSAARARIEPLAKEHCPPRGLAQRQLRRRGPRGRTPSG